MGTAPLGSAYTPFAEHRHGFAATVKATYIKVVSHSGSEML
jgi:hypothetical protein